MSDIYEVDNFREQLGWSKSEMASFFDTSGQNYNNWIKRNTLPKNSFKQARWLITSQYDLNSTTEELREQCLRELSNQGNLIASLAESNPIEHRSLEELIERATSFDYSSVARTVPILSWETARNWETHIQSGEIKQQGVTTCPAPNSELTFALRVELDDMYDNGPKDGHDDEEEGIAPGSIIFVDPTIRDGFNKYDKVLARYDKSGKIAFRRIHPETDNSDTFLEAINADYEAGIDHIEIIGKVIGYFRPL